MNQLHFGHFYAIFFGQAQAVDSVRLGASWKDAYSVPKIQLLQNIVTKWMADWHIPEEMGFPKGQHRHFVELEERRVQAVQMLRLGASQASVARQVGVHRQSVSRWARLYKDDGFFGLRSIPAGRKPRLNDEQVEEVRSYLIRFERDRRYWSVEDWAERIEEVTGVRFHPDHIYRLCARYGWGRG
jgi:transposase